MNRILHDANNAQRILKLTADTMLLVDRHGVCVDIEPHCDLWFLQEDILLGKNIFELLPEYTRERVMPIFQIVLEEQRSISKNFKLVLKGETFYFKCLMFPYDGMVLCQYRDITQRSNVKRQLEQANLTLRAIQKVAQIGQWTYNTKQNIFHYLGYTGVLCEENVQNLAIEKYVELIVEEDRQSFMEWCRVNEKELNMESISYRVRLNGEIFYMRIPTYLREHQYTDSCHQQRQRKYLCRQARWHDYLCQPSFPVQSWYFRKRRHQSIKDLQCRRRYAYTRGLERTLQRCHTRWQQ